MKTLLVIVIGLLLSATASAEPMRAPAPPAAPRIRLASNGRLVHLYRPRDNDTRQVIVVDAAKENALTRYLDDTDRLAFYALRDGNLVIAWDLVTGALIRFEDLVGSAVDRFANGRALLEAHAYLVLALRNPAEARRLCAADISRPNLAEQTCAALER